MGPCGQLGGIPVNPRAMDQATRICVYIEHIRQVKGQVVTFLDLTATLKSAGSFKKQGTEA